MAFNIVQAKWSHTAEEEEQEQEQEEEQEEEGEEEEEALSLCDLPISLEDQATNQQQCSRPNDATQEDFNFRSWGPPFSKEPQMCAADEVFFKGQILPLRLSFSSEAGLLAAGSQRQQHYYGKQFVRSESLDRGSLSDFPSNSSSRSSSLRSQNSSSSTSSTTVTRTPRTKPRVRNQFHTHPSPKPQLRQSGPTQLSSLGNQGRKSTSTSAWGIFRLGVVPAPEIGLQDLKVRNRNCVVSRNSSSSSSNSGKSVKTSNRNRNKGNHNVLKQLVGKGGGLLSGCDCSFETVQSNSMVIIKGGGKSMNTTESRTHAAKEKVVDSKKQKHRQKQGKKVTSRRRTFEWLKDLHASHPDEEALLSNPS
ncbi:hypothetical protein VNO78_26579 [Psophocarpus tetragonolobus]|uniref:Uncharacterized protein n=1 Tax=Psophocarpus tetragonolobus TaxID=3891 RepID=A0AAN9X933_PSOTE